MKTLVWSLTALLALLWTGFIALLHQLSGWLLGAADGAALHSAAGAVERLALPPLPPGLAPWIDTAWLAEWQAVAVSVVQWLGSVLPSGEAVMGWLGPMLWIGWGLVLVPLMGLAALLHAWLGPRRAPGSRPAHPS